MATTIWTYNAARLQGKTHEDETYLLLARRKGITEDLFWHLPCGMPEEVPSFKYGALSNEDERYDRGARAALKNEARLTLSEDREKVKISKLFVDTTREIDNSDEHKDVVHMLVDHGKVDKLPKVTAQTHDYGGGPVGPVELQWVKISEIEHTPEPNRKVHQAASQHYSFRGLPLRSMVIEVVNEFIDPTIRGPGRSNLSKRLSPRPKGLQNPKPE